MIWIEVAFWVMIACPIYAMALYPLLMYLLSKIIRIKFKREPITPSVSLIIAAYNEEASLEAKLENSLAIDYPADKLEIIVASDSSDDGTDDIARRYADRGVRLVRSEGNQGKSPTLNLAASEATGDILCFSDATGMWSKESIRAMAEHYADPRIGCVSGKVTYVYDGSATASGFNAYQRFVTALRRAEASFASGFNAPGSIHSIRRSLYLPLPRAVFGDMADPYHTAIQGKRTSLEERATSCEESRVRLGDEWAARKRICLRAWAMMFYSLRRFPLFKSPMYCLQVASHKYCRWLVGPFMLPILILNIVLLREHPIYAAVLVAQGLYYGATLLALLASPLGIRLPGLSALLFYNTVNFGYAVTFAGYLMGQRAVRWKPCRERTLRDWSDSATIEGASNGQ